MVIFCSSQDFDIQKPIDFLFACSYVCLFYTVYGQSLEKDIKGDTSGNFEDLLVELSKVSVKSSYRLTNDSGSEEIFRVGVST